MPSNATTEPRLGPLRLVARALVLRCPHCGARGLFSRWFQMAPHCFGCGLASDRMAGHWIGAVGINTIVTFGVIFVVLMAGFLATFPDIAAGPITIAAVAAAIGVPVVFFPFSRTLWAAIDLWMRPAEPHELTEPGGGDS